MVLIDDPIDLPGKIGDTVSLILEKWSTSTCTWRYNKRPDDPNSTWTQCVKPKCHPTTKV